LFESAIYRWFPADCLHVLFIITGHPLMYLRYDGVPPSGAAKYNEVLQARKRRSIYNGINTNDKPIIHSRLRPLRLLHYESRDEK